MPYILISTNFNRYIALITFFVGHAAAGTFGGFGEIPLTIPSAGSYSGSFSKSSSSSQASSSASSSSSSFSFSGTGHYPNAIGSDANVTPGAGCSSGTCQSEIKGAPGYGAGGTGSGSNAAVISGAGTYVGSTANSKPCTTGDCSNQNQRCDGANCNYNLNKKQCTSGQCSPSGTAPTYFEDIPVNVGSSTTTNTYNANEKPHSSLPTSTAYGCSNGNCGSASTPKPIYSQTSGGAFPSSSGPVNKPAIHLTSPKEQAPCTSTNCGSPTGGAYDTENLPSSYNVPIQGSYSAPSSPEKPCSTGNCAPSYLYPPSSSATIDCVSGNCNKAPLPSTDFNTKKQTPSNSQDDIPDFIPLTTILPSATANCGTPNCVTSPSTAFKYPSYLQQGSHSNTPTSAGSGSNLFTGSYDATKPASIVSSVTEKLPPYTGGFRGPPGILKPNENSLPSKILASDYKPSVPLGSHTPPTGSSVPLGSHTSPTGSSLPNNQNTSPTGLQPKPTYNPTAPSAPSYQPTPSPGLYKPPCTSGNCGNLPTTSYPIYPPYAPTGTANVPSYKPTGPLACTSGNCVQQLPCTTGNCGALPQQPTSTGSYVSTTCTSGNCGSKPTKPLNYDNIPSGSYKPTSQASSFPSSCSYGNCASPQPGLLQGGSNEPSSPTGFYKPSTCTSGNCDTKPSQPLNYGNIPIGIYKPTSPGSSFPSSCSTGNCAPTQPVFSQGGPYELTSPAGSSKPCTSGNCGSQSSQSSNYGQAGTSTSTATGSYHNHGQNKPTYDFGGPPGVLKPNDFGTPTVSLPMDKPTAPGSYNPTPCTSENCAIQHGPGAPSSNGQYNPALSGSYNPSSCTYGNCGAHSGQSRPSSHGQYKPTTSGSYNPTACSSGNCGYSPSQFGENSGTHVSGSATASANALVYTGGFGGPPGLLKPYDDGKLIGTGIASFGNPHFGNPSVPGINSPNGKSLAYGTGISSGAATQAKTFRGGNYEASDNGVSGCKDGCGSSGIGNYGLSGAAAKSQASAGAFGFGGGYASSSASAHASAGAVTKGGKKLNKIKSNYKR